MPARGDDAKRQERKTAIVRVAVSRFAHRGLYGTSTQEIANEVGISQPYIYRLFANKTELFVAAIEHVSDVLAQSHITAAAEIKSGSKEAVEVLTRSYSRLLTDEVLLRFLMQASCALDEPTVVEALRACWAKQVRTLQDAGAVADEDIRQILGANLLDNVVVGLGLHQIAEPWAKVMSGR